MFILLYFPTQCCQNSENLHPNVHISFFLQCAFSKITNIAVVEVGAVLSGL